LAGSIVVFIGVLLAHRVAIGVIQKAAESCREEHSTQYPHRNLDDLFLGIPL
jgi:hypothetical protein